jgi:hypothetical protein
MLSDYKDVIWVILFYLFHSVTYFQNLEAASCIAPTLELYKTQCRKVYAILLASLFHTDPNYSIVIL